MNLNYSFLCSGAIVLVLFASVGHSIKCFQCTSVNDTTCADIEATNTALEYYKECNGNYGGKEPFCRKTIQTIIDVEKIVRVHRSCGWEPDLVNPKPCYKYENDFHFEVVCVCDTDGCNAASTGFPWTTGVLLAAGVVTARTIWGRSNTR